MTAVVRGARIIGGVGLAVVGGLHALWAAGSHWPARSHEGLAEAIIGTDEAVPGAVPTAIVAGGALATGAVVAGGLGDSRLAVRWRRFAGAGLLVRAAVGGDVALAVLGWPAAGEKFLKLDNRVYRPLCAVLGIAVLVGARSKRVSSSV